MEQLWRLCGGRAGAEMVGHDEVLRHFSRKLNEARKLYRPFVLEGLGEGHKEAYYDVLEGRFLRDREFAEEIKEKANILGYVRSKIKAEALLGVACRMLGRRRAEVMGAGKERERVRAREAICYVGRNCTELSVTALAKSLGVDAKCQSRGAARVESRFRNDKALRKVIDEIVSAVENSKNQA
jgi:hypothetical protein